jgi:hypothetical protein
MFGDPCARFFGVENDLIFFSLLRYQVPLMGRVLSRLFRYFDYWSYVVILDGCG